MGEPNEAPRHRSEVSASVRRRVPTSGTVALAGLLLSTACYRSWFDYADVEDDGDRTGGDDAGSTDGEDAGPDGDVPARCPAGMVFVPAGPFVMGADPREVDSPTEAEPEHVVYVSSFCIDVLEVTNADWRSCVEGGGCTPPRPDLDRVWCDGSYGPEVHPVTCVNHGQAQGYCRWAGKRLPTEAEWEKAARGGCEVVAPDTCGPEDERDYPWGPAPAADRCCDYYNCVLGTEEVGIKPLGAGPYGTLDQVGNVGEWVADYYDPEAYAACATGCADPIGTPYGDRAISRGGPFGCGEPFSEALCLIRPVAIRDDRPAVNGGCNGGLRCAVRP